MFVARWKMLTIYMSNFHSATWLPLIGSNTQIKPRKTKNTAVVFQVEKQDGNQKPECSHVILRWTGHNKITVHLWAVLSVFKADFSKDKTTITIQHNRTLQKKPATTTPTPENTSPQHFSIKLLHTTLLHNTSPQHFAATLLYKTSPKHVSATLHHNTSPPCTTLLQPFSTTLLHNISLQPFSTTLLHNTSLQHFTTTLLYHPSLQHFFTTLPYNPSPPRFSTTLLQNISLHNTSPQHFSTTRHPNTSAQHSFTKLLNPSPQLFSTTLHHNTSPQHFSTTLHQNTSHFCNEKAARCPHMGELPQ